MGTMVATIHDQYEGRFSGDDGRIHYFRRSDLEDLRVFLFVSLCDEANAFPLRHRSSEMTASTPRYASRHVWCADCLASRR